MRNPAEEREERESGRKEGRGKFRRSADSTDERTEGVMVGDP